MKRIALPCGESVPALGQGTWHVGDDPSRRQEEIATLQHGIALGLALVDTAEMYGDGRSEQLVGEALAGRRDQVFLVSKVYPHHASRQAMRRACEASLRRLRVEAIDLYLLHWPGAVPLAETVQAFEALQGAGKIRHWGISNFDLEGMQALWRTPGGPAAQTNQVLYHLGERGIEWDLRPRLGERRLPVMAYSPFDEGRLLKNRALVAFARRHGSTPAQVALAWLLAQDGVIAIPKTGSRARVEENAGALARPLSAAQLEELGRHFPAPQGPTPLSMI
ncbi:aldo/keto reductase [Ramlibacter solisilvae]|uniref:Aldo/keto reductase n=1 Tax=Ramlibacter tataouinensis TaxID=94132 RepID=A0A127JT78_9BURK|nr:aldo/keto reductase [Ramlibacter tataouinensis]AMO23221.1 aldo/keto reductase [Ramlibacter tataouinensis]